ncbi:MAG TPA: hypothetical protein VFE24_09275 [Pirellulales bacterium]|jgi:hypothetical protein|nr:hypothetical protein [Pirellulales bacterium]
MSKLVVLSFLLIGATSAIATDESVIVRDDRLTHNTEVGKLHKGMSKYEFYLQIQCTQEYIHGGFGTVGFGECLGTFKGRPATFSVTFRQEILYDWTVHFGFDKNVVSNGCPITPARLRTLRADYLFLLRSTAKAQSNECSGSPPAER